MGKLWDDFKAFTVKGNLVEIAVGLVLALAFTTVVTSLLDDIFWPIIGGILSDRSFAALTFDFLGAEVRYGNFINSVIYFFMVALILFAVIMGYDQLRQKDVTTKSCPFCVSTIPLAATRCPNCTSQLDAA